MEIKFRYFEKSTKKLIYPGKDGWFNKAYKHVNGAMQSIQIGIIISRHNRGLGIMEQSLGLTSSNDQEWYVGDMGEFPNGDKFILKMENWLEIFADWIGDPECEDQTRDLYRIERAKKIGTIHDK
ncbi:MAG: hypothetical protein V3W20_11300 [Candidatus Neomarinimicrobiota bacterium]